MTLLVLICGLLGSGKTTFLHQLIPLLQKGDLVPHLIINDYVNATIDASLFRDLGTAVRAISGSCVCCDSQEELIDAMAEMRFQKRSVLLIETNGTADTELLIEQLTLDVRLRHFSLPIAVAVVDAKHWQKRPWSRSLEVSQVKTGNYLYVSRSDLVDAERLEALRCDLEKKRIQGQMITPQTFVARLLELIEGQDGAAMRAPVRPNEDGPSRCPHAETHYFASAEILMPHAVNRTDFIAFMDRLPEEVIRAKGVIQFIESPGRYFLFQYIGGMGKGAKPASLDHRLILLEMPTLNLATQSIFVGVRLPLEEIKEGLARLARGKAVFLGV